MKLCGFLNFICNNHTRIRQKWYLFRMKTACFHTCEISPGNFTNFCNLFVIFQNKKFRIYDKSVSVFDHSDNYLFEYCIHFLSETLWNNSNRFTSKMIECYRKIADFMIFMLYRKCPYRRKKSRCLYSSSSCDSWKFTFEVLLLCYYVSFNYSVPSFIRYCRIWRSNS